MNLDARIAWRESNRERLSIIAPIVRAVAPGLARIMSSDEYMNFGIDMIGYTVLAQHKHVVASKLKLWSIIVDDPHYLKTAGTKMVDFSDFYTATRPHCAYRERVSEIPSIAIGQWRTSEQRKAARVRAGAGTKLRSGIGLSDASEVLAILGNMLVIGGVTGDELIACGYDLLYQYAYGQISWPHQELVCAVKISLSGMSYSISDRKSYRLSRISYIQSHIAYFKYIGRILKKMKIPEYDYLGIGVDILLRATVDAYDKNSKTRVNLWKHVSANYKRMDYAIFDGLMNRVGAMDSSITECIGFRIPEDLLYMFSGKPDIVDRYAAMIGSSLTTAKTAMITSLLVPLGCIMGAIMMPLDIYMYGIDIIHYYAYSPALCQTW